MLAGIIDLTTFTVVHDIDRDFLDSVLLLELNESSILVVTEVDILTRLKEVVRYATGVDRLYFLLFNTNTRLEADEHGQHAWTTTGTGTTT